MKVWVILEAVDFGDRIYGIYSDQEKAYEVYNELRFHSWRYKMEIHNVIEEGVEKQHG